MKSDESIRVDLTKIHIERNEALTMAAIMNIEGDLFESTTSHGGLCVLMCTLLVLSIHLLCCLNPTARVAMIRGLSVANRVLSEEQMDDSLEAKVKHLLAKGSLTEKVNMMKLLKQGLNDCEVRVTLESITSSGGCERFNRKKAEKQVLSNKFVNEFTINKFEQNLLMQLWQNKPLGDDETLSEACVDCFIIHMGLILSEEYRTEMGWDYPAKSSLDAIIVSAFVDYVNDHCQGLTKDQTDRVNNSVIGQFNSNVKEHHKGLDHFELVLKRQVVT